MLVPRDSNPFIHRFGFKWHCLKTLQLQTIAPISKCMGYSRFEDCPITVNVKLTDKNHPEGRMIRKRLFVPQHQRNKGQHMLSHISQLEKPWKQHYQRSLYLESMQKLASQEHCIEQKRNKKTSFKWAPKSPKMADGLTGTDNVALQKVMMHPKGLMLWSNKCLCPTYGERRKLFT